MLWNELSKLTLVSDSRIINFTPMWNDMKRSHPMLSFLGRTRTPRSLPPERSSSYGRDPFMTLCTQEPRIPRCNRGNFPLAKKDVSCHTCWSLESQKRLAVDFLIQGLATPESLRGKEFRCSGAQIFLLVENHHPVGWKTMPPKWFGIAFNPTTPTQQKSGLTWDEESQESHPSNGASKPGCQVTFD